MSSHLYARYVPPKLHRDSKPTAEQVLVKAAVDDPSREENKPPSKRIKATSVAKTVDHLKLASFKFGKTLETFSGDHDLKSERPLRHGAEEREQKQLPNTRSPIVADAYGSVVEKRKKKVKDPKDQAAAPGDTNGIAKHTEAEEILGRSKHRDILSKYHKSTSRAKSLEATVSTAATSGDSYQQVQPGIAGESKGLNPLPQPTPVQESLARPAFSALPSWIEHPVPVSSTQKKPFKDLNVSPKLLDLLQAKGYEDAFAVQSTVLPMLLPGAMQHNGDLCISAATGSGKTLAYVLPIVESLRDRAIIKLRGLVIVPTRELVLQVREVCEMCCSGTGIKVQTAVGSRSFKAEQEDLIERGQRYDSSLTEGHLKPMRHDKDDSDFEFTVDEIDNANGSSNLPGHVVEYQSKADILICTPGRLVEHIRATPGFTLDYMQWLVIDEADKLLSQTYQGWLDILMENLEREKSFEGLRADQRILHKLGNWRGPKPPKKVVLSATMTRDLSKLNRLNLRTPKLVVLDNLPLSPALMPDEDFDLTASHDLATAAEQTYDLPKALQEWAVPVGDGSKKPLYLLRLLQTKIFKSKELDAPHSSSSSPASSSASNTSGTEDSIDSEPDSTSNSSSSDFTSSSSPQSQQLLSTEKALSKFSNKNTSARNHGVLIFTKSNESALRLARLLTLLHAPYGPLIGNLTSMHASTSRRKTLRSFVSSHLSILIASDLVARGMDIPSLAHVVNYDLPTSVRGYVHRVGRTARAEREGEAWSLVSDKEARWFWNAIARGEELRRSRGRKVVRCRIDLESSQQDSDGKRRYEEALRSLGEEVRGGK